MGFWKTVGLFVIALGEGYAVAHSLHGQLFGNSLFSKRGFAKGARKNKDGSDNKTFNRTEAQYNSDQAKKGNK